MSLKQIEGLEVEAAVALIIAKPIHTLDSDEKAFLRARTEYLSEDQKEVFAVILEDKAEKTTKKTKEE